MRAVTDAQVRKLMEEMSKHGQIGDAAMKAGMHRMVKLQVVIVHQQHGDRAQRDRMEQRSRYFARSTWISPGVHSPVQVP